MGAIGTLAVNVIARTEKFAKGMKRSQRLTRGLRTGMLALTAVAGIMATTLTAVARENDKINVSLNKSLAIMPAVSAEMRQSMLQTAIDVARTTRAGVSDATDAYFFLASAGLDAQQSLAAMPAVAAFAQAGAFDLALATDLATDAQSALGLTVQDSSQNLENLTRVTDVLIKANTLANASAQQFSEAVVNGVGAALKLVNKDIEEGVAVLAAYADQGIKGAEAGTAFGIVMRDLQTKALNFKSEFRAANVAVFDATGTMRPLSKIIADIERKLGGMSDAQKKVTLAQLGFSDKSVKYIQTLLGTSEKIADYEQKLRNAAGTTQEVADKQMTNLEKATSKLGAAFSQLSLNMQGTVEELANIIERVAAVVEWFGRQKQALDAIETLLISISAGVLLLAKGFVSVAKAIANVGVVALESFEAVAGGLHESDRRNKAFLKNSVRELSAWEKSLDTSMKGDVWDYLGKKSKDAMEKMRGDANKTSDAVKEAFKPNNFQQAAFNKYAKQFGDLMSPFTPKEKDIVKAADLAAKTINAGLKQGEGLLSNAIQTAISFAAQGDKKLTNPSLTLTRTGSAESFQQRRAIERQSRGIDSVGKKQLEVQKEIRDGINKMADAEDAAPANLAGV